jgi:D-alanyl-D-alanine carboxypeptidase
MRLALPVLAVCAFVLVGCGATTTPAGANGAGKATICGKALGSVALNEVSDDAQRKAHRAQETADLLSTLATETQDHTLADALRAAADEAREVSGRDWSGARLKAWAQQEQARFDALRRACS